MRNTILIAAVGGAGLILGACTTDLEKSQASQPTGGTEFTRALGSDYHTMAANQWNGQVDFQASERFARKAMAADQGEAVPPDDPTANGPPVRLDPELADAHARLMNVLGTDAPKRKPLVTARAQTAYDCWLDEASDPIQGVEGQWLENKVRNCRDDFMSAMAEIGRPVAAATPPAAASQVSLVFFDFDSAKLKPEGEAVIQAAIDNIKRGGASRIVVVGNTDLVGTDAYNQALSQRRAEAVRGMLLHHGISDARIVTVARGDTQPLVQTAKGVPEPQNRRAEINLE